MSARMIAKMRKNLYLKHIKKSEKMTNQKEILRNVDRIRRVPDHTRTPADQEYLAQYEDIPAVRAADTRFQRGKLNPETGLFEDDLSKVYGE